MVYLAKKKVINLKVAHSYIVKKILLIKTLNKLCLTIFYLYIL